MIIRLITEHIELNSFLFKLKLKCPKNNKIPDSNKCNECNKIESVKHYILDCKRYNGQRLKLFNNIIKINHKYKYGKFRTIKYLLFPYKLFRNNEQQQIKIWKEILGYIKATNRFENLYGINLKEITN